MLAGRGVSVAHTTVMRWVQHYVPVFEKRWMKYARPTEVGLEVVETNNRVSLLVT